MRVPTVYEVTYFNALLNQTYKAKTDNPMIMKEFLNQLSTGKCIVTISGKTEQIFTYADPDYNNDADIDALSRHDSLIDDTSVYLTMSMEEQMDSFVQGDVSIMARDLPDHFAYELLPFVKGTFSDKLVKCIIPAIYRVLVDSHDSCLDTVKTICNKDIIAPAPPRLF